MKSCWFNLKWTEGIKLFLMTVHLDGLDLSYREHTGQSLLTVASRMLLGSYCWVNKAPLKARKTGKTVCHSKKKWISADLIDTLPWACVVYCVYAAFQPNGGPPISSTSKRIEGSELKVADGSFQPYSTPRALETEEIPKIIGEYVSAAKNAISAGAALIFKMLSMN